MTDSLIGQQFGAYELRERLGSGGMASVYRAFDHRLQREVALKLLQDSSGQLATFSQPESAERFRREAQTLASLRHPGIVQIYDFGQQDNISYIVQELLPGPTLERELDELYAEGRTMEPDSIQQIVAQVASALDYVHARHIIHRDLKPGNIMRNRQGDFVLVDFGIARRTETTGMLQLTQTGFVVGTPHYIAPEQAMGGSAVGPGSDIYALGVIVFRMLTGRVPFDAPTSMGIVIAHLNQQAPTPRTIRPDLPTAVEQVVLKALAKEPADRYPSAGALAEALSMAWGRPDMLHYTPTVPHPVSPVNPDVHNMQTVADQALPQPAVPVAATTGTTPAPPDEVPPPPPVVPSSVRRGRAMGWLVGVLGLLLLCGAVYGITQLTGGGAAAPAVMPSPTDTPTTMPPTFTSVPPTSVPTATAVPPTATAVPPTNTPLPPTDTPVPPTPTLFPTTAPLPTFTPVPPTFTLVPPTPEPTTGAEVQDPPLVEKTPPGLERAPGQRRTPENGPPERNTSLSPYPAPDA